MVSKQDLHIAVMGTGGTIDTALKVGHLGISSVMSLVDDILIEQIRKYYEGPNYIPVKGRAQRITAYLNYVNSTVQNKFELVRNQEFVQGTELMKYIQMLPTVPTNLEEIIRGQLMPGSIDVNIMSALNGAEEALEGFANSNLDSSVVFSAHMVKSLYRKLPEFEDFLPKDGRSPKKKVILKVSDLRSARIQSNFLAKQGIWVDEYRIESGLNCGGHAFATEGFLSGPALDEFMREKEKLINANWETYTSKLQDKGIKAPSKLNSKLTYQGGITTGHENEFIKNKYNLDGTGVATPFLVVPEATSIDLVTLELLIKSTLSDVKMSDSSPLGIIFQNLMSSLSEDQRKKLIEEGDPGSICSKGYLRKNTDYTTKSICTASKQYIGLRITDLKEQRRLGKITPDQYKLLEQEAYLKSCICDHLGDTALSLYNIHTKRDKYPAICPGPNITDFKQKYALEEMLNHLHGREHIISASKHMFIRELDLYIDHFENKDGKVKKNYVQNLFSGIAYYESIANEIHPTEQLQFKQDLAKSKQRLELMIRL